MKVLEWMFKMVDRISGPAGNIHRSLSGVQDSLHKVDVASGGAQGSTAKAGASMGILSGITSAVTSKVLELAAAVPRIGFGLASAVVQQAAFKSNTLVSLELMLKSKEAAQGLFKQVTQMANTTPFQVGDVLTTVQTLVGAGYEANKAMDLFKGIGDVAALKNFDPEVLQRVTLAITQMKGKGKIAAEELNQIAEASGGVIGRKSIIDALSQQLGKTPEVISKEMELGRISADDGINAIMSAIQDGISGGKLGGLMDRLGTSIPGLMSTIGDAFNAAIPSVEDSPGLQSFQGFLGRMVTLLDSEQGVIGTRLKTLVSVVTDGIGSIFDGLGGQDQAPQIAAVMDTIVGAVQWLGQTASYTWKNFVSPFWDGLKSGVKGAWSVISPVLDTIGSVLERVFGSTGGPDGWTNALQTLGKALGWLAGVAIVGAGALAALSALPGAVVTAVSVGAAALWNYLTGLYQQFTDFGANIVTGIQTGLQNAWQGLVSTFTGMVEALPGVVRTVLGIGSPSRVMFGLMDDTVQGAVNGVTARAPDLAGAMTNAVQPPVVAPLVPQIAAPAVVAGGAPGIRSSVGASAGAALPGMPPEASGAAAPSISVPAPSPQQFGGGAGAMGGITFGDINVAISFGAPASGGAAPSKQEAKAAGEAAADGFLAKLRAALDGAALQAGAI